MLETLFSSSQTLILPSNHQFCLSRHHMFLPNELSPTVIPRLDTNTNHGLFWRIDPGFEWNSIVVIPYISMSWSGNVYISLCYMEFITYNNYVGRNVWIYLMKSVSFNMMWIFSIFNSKTIIPTMHTSYYSVKTYSVLQYFFVHPHLTCSHCLFQSLNNSDLLWIKCQRE